MVAERRRLGALDVLEPPQILGGQLPEGDAPAAALRSVTLKQRPVSVVFTTSASIRSAACASVSTPSGGRPRFRRQPPDPSDSAQARPSARTTGWQLRDHLPYQNGPVDRWRM